jgi:cell division transport system permease protein
MPSLAHFPDRPRLPPPRPVPRRRGWRARWGAWGYGLREGWLGFRRNGLMTVAAVSTTTVALLALAAALLALWNLRALAAAVESQLVAVAYLREGLGPRERQAAQQRARSLAGAREVQFVPREEALRRLERALGGVDLDEALRANPLPDTLEVRPERAADLPELAAALRQVPGVVDVTYGADVAERVLGATNLVRWAGLGGTLGLAGVAAVVSYNALRLTILARRREIEIMRLVGATASFIRWPFLVEGTLHGLAGGLVACALSLAGYAVGVTHLVQAWPFLPLVSWNRVALPLVGAVLAAGVLVGLVGSAASVARYVRL